MEPKSTYDEYFTNVIGQINNLSIKSVDVKKPRIQEAFESDDTDFDNDDMLWSEDSPKHILTPGKIFCSDCNIAMSHSIKEMVYECEQCGKIEEMDGDEIETDTGTGSADIVGSYNTSALSSSSVRISGPNGHMYQKKMIASTSNYKKTQRKNTVDQMSSTVFKYNGSQPPANVVYEAADVYHELQQHCIKRGNVRLGIMAACLYKVCAKNNIDRKPKEIAVIFNIAQNELSNGEKILDQLIADGSVKSLSKPTPELDSIESQDKKTIISFLNRYFDSLNIPRDLNPDSSSGQGSSQESKKETKTDGPDYMNFAINLIRFTIKYDIAASSIISSKCAGAMFILAIQCPELKIKKESIETECTISKSTYHRYVQAVRDMLYTDDEKYKKVRSRLRKIFKNHKIAILAN